MKKLKICIIICTISHVSNFGNFNINLLGRAIFLFIENIYLCICGSHKPLLDIKVFLYVLG